MRKTTVTTQTESTPATPVVLDAKPGTNTKGKGRQPARLTLKQNFHLMSDSDHDEMTARLVKLTENAELPAAKTLESYALTRYIRAGVIPPPIKTPNQFKELLRLNEIRPGVKLYFLTEKQLDAAIALFPESERRVMRLEYAYFQRNLMFLFPDSPEDLFPLDPSKVCFGLGWNGWREFLGNKNVCDTCGSEVCKHSKLLAYDDWRYCADEKLKRPDSPLCQHR